MSKQMRYEYFNKLQFSPYNRAPAEPVDFRFGHKPIVKSTESQNDEQNPSDLANLESRFGHNSSILSDNRKFQEAISIDDARSSSSSEIDCEEIENWVGKIIFPNIFVKNIKNLMSWKLFFRCGDGNGKLRYIETLKIKKKIGNSQQDNATVLKDQDSNPRSKTLLR